MEVVASNWNWALYTHTHIIYIYLRSFVEVKAQAMFWVDVIPEVFFYNTIIKNFTKLDII